MLYDRFNLSVDEEELVTHNSEVLVIKLVQVYRFMEKWLGDKFGRCVQPSNSTSIWRIAIIEGESH